MVFSDPDFKEEDPNFLSRSERYDQAVKKSAQMILKLREYGIADPEEIYCYKKYVVNESSLVYIHPVDPEGLFRGIMCKSSCESAAGSGRHKRPIKGCMCFNLLYMHWKHLKHITHHNYYHVYLVNIDATVLQWLAQVRQRQFDCVLLVFAIQINNQLRNVL